MQAVEQSNANVGTGAFIRVMAAFGTIVAIVLVIGAVLLGGSLLAGAITPHANSTSVTDPFEAPSIVDFRRSEHAEAAQQLAGDPWTAPSVVQTRISEHGDGAQQLAGDPWTAPSVVQTRISEHAEAR